MKLEDIDTHRSHPEAVKLFKNGHTVCVSTSIADTITYGYGELDDYGFWEFALVKKVQDEFVGKCKICHKLLYRHQYNKWYYHQSIGVVCRNHPGVDQWYQNLLDESEKELRKLGVIK